MTSRRTPRPASISTTRSPRSPRPGITATGETGADDPLQAADDGLREFAAHEIVFVTKPGTDTDWVERGVVEAARKRYAVPVTHIALSGHLSVCRRRVGTIAR